MIEPTERAASIMLVPGLAMTSLPSMVQVTKPGFFGGGGPAGLGAGGGGAGGVALLAAAGGVSSLGAAGGLDGSEPIFAAGVSVGAPLGGGCASPEGFLVSLSLTARPRRRSC